MRFHEHFPIAKLPRAAESPVERWPPTLYIDGSSHERYACPENDMTIDKSLRVKRGATRNRSVMTRVERIQRLREADRWKEGDSPLGLPKVRVRKLTMKKKKKKKEDEEGAAEGGTAAVAPVAAKPAAGKAAAAKPAAGKTAGGKAGGK
jgi:small basic protein (TIGR04137 family)